MSLWSRLMGIRLPRLPLPINLPPPATFAEGQRSLFGCLASMAGMSAFVFVVWVTRFFMTGKWSEAVMPLVINNLGWALILMISVMAFVTVGLLVGGPVGRFKGGLGKDGANFEVEDRDVSQATANATVTVTAPAAPAKSKPAEPAAPTEEPFSPGGV